MHKIVLTSLIGGLVLVGVASLSMPQSAFAIAVPGPPPAAAPAPATKGDASTGGTIGTGNTSTGGGTIGTGNTSSGNDTTLVNPLKNIDSLPELVNAILDAIVTLGSIALTLALIWVGFLFVAARGAPEKITAAKTALIWTVVGGLILLGAKAIGLVIQSTVGTLTS